MLSKPPPNARPWQAAHDRAASRKKTTYTDPDTGSLVFTAYALRERGTCCGAGCRHCPYGHELVPAELRMELDREPWIEGEVRKGQRHDLLFWSGGKDSFLALRKLQADRRNPVVLCTTFDGRTERVSQQELTLETIQRHAAGLGIPVLLIPLYPGGDYLDSVAAGLTVLRRHVSVDRFVFGDLHLRDIRDWREQAFASLANKAGANLYFPLWHQPYDQLLADLAASGATCRVSAVTADALSGVVSVGDVFGPELIGRLPDGVDAFGEHGEFHTGLELG